MAPARTRLPNSLDILLDGVLPSWHLREAAPLQAADVTARTLWSDGQGLTISALNRQEYLVSFAGKADFAVRCADKTVTCHAPAGFVSTDTCKHYVLDQLAPRLLAHEGAFVAHAAALCSGSRAFLLVGVSGRGKSTLAAALEQFRAELLGDDAAILSLDGDKVMVRAVYRSLRLLPDSLEALFAGSRASSPMADNSAKRRLTVDPRLADAPVPLAGVFVLQPPVTEEGARFAPMVPSDACMELLRESFALDPSDTRLAADRLRIAGAIAEQVPVFTLAYPRDYARLAEVTKAVLDKVDDLS